MNYPLGTEVYWTDAEDREILGEVVDNDFSEEYPYKLFIGPPGTEGRNEYYVLAASIDVVPASVGRES